MNFNAPFPTIQADAGARTSSSWTHGTCIDKPTYAVPPMAEIMAAPDIGLTHVSTFSGAGGTCLGFRLAGFRTLLANDCDARATACYRANMPSPIDPRPIQQLTAEEVLRLTGLERGELDVFEGSPPCTSFSTAGKRSAGWGKNKEHAGVIQQKIEDLFFEWLRLLDGLQPRAFVAENVSGMVKGVAKGYFKLVLAEMKRIGYVVEARLLDAQWLGVPQARVRIIFIGMRNDLGLTPAFPTPLPYRYSVRDALPWIDGSIEGANGFNGHAPSAPSATVQAGRPVRVMHDTNGSFASGGDVTDRPAPSIVARRPSFTVETEARRGQPSRLRDGAYGAKTLDNARPASTITIGSPGNDAALRTGPDRTDRRKLSILEVKRLCSFPDDYDLTPAGGYSHQWARLGNSVPPLMAYHIARCVRDVLLSVPTPAPHG